MFGESWGRAGLAALYGDILLFGAENGNLYALDTASGTPRWKLAVHPSGEAPAVVDGIAYCGTDDSLIAIDVAKAKVIWSCKISSGGGSSPAVVNGAVYLRTANGSLYAVEARTGKELWTYRRAGTGFWVVRTSPSVWDGKVYFTDEHGQLLGLDLKTGTKKWQPVPKPERAVSTTAAIAKGLVFFGGLGGMFYAYDAKTGQERWRFDTKTKYLISEPAVGEDAVYFGDPNGVVHALAVADGQEKWNLKTDDSVNSKPTIVNGALYFVNDRARLYAVDAASGRTKWTYEIGSGARWSGGNYTEVIVSGGALYLGAGNQYVAIR
jgi:outer membrane protein assembly factor BamB